jgi:glycosyltransferase involved in cell wall biosynthesis
MGPTVATEIILNSALKNRFQLIHLDTSDKRDLSTLGVLDFQNVYLAIKHYFMLLWRIINRWPDIVYIPVSQTTIGYLKDSGFIIIAALFRRKIVCHLRGGNFRNWYESAGAFTRWYVRRVHSLVDAQIVLGERLRSLFSHIMPSHKIFVVPNGRDFARFRRNPGTNASLKVLYLGNFLREKGALDVIRAIPLVSRQRPEIEFILAGDWTDEAVKREAHEYLRQYEGLPVRLLGTVTGRDKHDLLTSADIFVFPSYYAPEGHPWVVVEAMAAGMPVISTDQGAIAEYVIDGDNGFIVKKQSPEMIAEKVLVLAGDPERRAAMGRRSRELYEENLTENSLVERLSGVFCSVLGVNKP